MGFSYRAKQLANLPVEKLASRLSAVVDHFSTREKSRLLQRLTADKTGCDLNNQLSGAISLAENTLPKATAEELGDRVEIDLKRNGARVKVCRARVEKRLIEPRPDTDLQSVWFGRSPMDERHLSHFNPTELSRYVPRFMTDETRKKLLRSYDSNWQEGGFTQALRWLVLDGWGYEHPATQTAEKAKFESDRLEKGRANIRAVSALLVYLNESENGRAKR